MADAGDQIAKENYDRFMRAMEKVAVILYKFSKEELQEIERRAAAKKARIIAAQDPVRAMRQEMKKATKAAYEKIEELRVNGLIDNVQARNMNRTINDMSRYYDLDDGCVKAATICKLAEKCHEKEQEFYKTQDKSIFKNMDKIADDYSKVPRAVYMDETRLHPSIKELKADIKIKQAQKEMEKTILQNRIKNGFEELVR